MKWKLYQLTYELLTPLHVGLIKINNVQRTRYYIPARAIWGTVTAILTRQRSESGNDYQKQGEWVTKNIISSYWYVLGDNDELLYPQFSNRQLRYGSLSESEFERRYITSIQGTAINPSSNTAQEGSLREFEVLSPHRIDTGTRVQFRAWLLLSTEAQRELETIKAAVVNLFVGGERKYGWGHLRQASFLPEPNMFCWFLSTRLDLNADLPTLLIEKGEVLPAHAQADALRASGAIEVFRGRQTVTSNAFGASFSESIVCWAPGSILAETTKVQLSILRPLQKA